MYFKLLMETIIFITRILIAMKKLVLTLVVFTILAVPATAQVTVNYDIGLDRILPGDTVECKLIISNPNPYPEELRSVVFWSDLVSPRIYSDLGVISSNSVYYLPFTFKAEEPGNYLVRVTVKTYNGIVTTYIPFTVINESPKIRLENPELVLGQKNVLKVFVDWYDNVTLRPLFNASPSESFGRSFEFVFYPEKKQILEFEIGFSNGNNFHAVRKSIEVSWVEEKGVSLNITGLSNAYSNEAVEITVVVTNMNTYRVEDLELKVGERIRKIAYLEPERQWSVKLYVQAEEEIPIHLSYRNQIGKSYSYDDVLNLEIIDESAVQICSYEFEKDLLTGQICNFGSTVVKNVIVGFENETYFVGTILPEDYEVFSIKTNRTEGTLNVSWKNLAGGVESSSMEIKGKKNEIIKGETGSEVLIISVVLAVVIVIVAVFALKRR